MTDKNNKSTSPSESQSSEENNDYFDLDESIDAGASSMDELVDAADSMDLSIERSAKGIGTALEKRDISLSNIGFFKMNNQELGANVSESREERGILSYEDRKYLWGQSNYDYKQSEYKARERIRDRTWNAILDFTDLVINMSEEDQSQVFERDDYGYLHDNLVMAFRFFYTGIDSDSDAFEEIIEQAVYEAETYADNQPEETEVQTVTVSLDVERGRNPDKLKKMLMDGKPLSDREIGVLVRQGDLSVEEVAEQAGQSREISIKRILERRFETGTNGSE